MDQGLNPQNTPRNRKNNITFVWPRCSSIARKRRMLCNGDVTESLSATAVRFVVFAKPLRTMQTSRCFSLANVFNVVCNVQWFALPILADFRRQPVFHRFHLDA